MSPYRTIDHTADLGIEVDAASREELFAEALAAFVDCITEVAKVRPRFRRRVRLEGAELDLLLVDWLGEALVAFEVDGELWGRAAVTLRREQGVWRLEAEVAGEEWDAERHPEKTAVKAVTYHGLEVGRGPLGWRARVILDL